MKRRFNTEGSCSPKYHYMVRLDDRLKKIKDDYVDYGKYFVINRGRQYGKTTTLRALESYLREDYIVLSLDFQGLVTEDFADAFIFSKAFAKIIIKAIELNRLSDGEELIQPLREFISGRQGENNLAELFDLLSGMCAESSKPIVLMIDEVDSASNNQVFIEFLAVLRQCYLQRDKMPIFHSVILAGVYDIKNLKLKLRPESEHKYNSPWNTRVGNEENECLHSFDECTRDQIELVRFDIAAKFNIDMSLSAGQIAGMLEEYEADHHTRMDIDAVAGEIYSYTSGYPVLVSSICKYLDEELPCDEDLEDRGRAWTKENVAKAVKAILKESSTLFDHMIRQLDIYKDMRGMFEQMLYRGRKISFSPAEKSINIGLMFGFLKEENGHVAVANRMFEMYLLDLFIAEESMESDIYLCGQDGRSKFVTESGLDMDLVLEKFVVHFNEIYGGSDGKFIEAYGRKFFLLYLKPIINGTGNYYIEAQTRDARRTDVIVDYAGEQFVIELKIWHGGEYNERGEKQLTEYLDYYHKDKGYMISFNFNKSKETGVKEITIGGKTIVEAVV